MLLLSIQRSTPKGNFAQPSGLEPVSTLGLVSGIFTQKTIESHGDKNIIIFSK